jgi:hypothetical protein
MVHGCLLGSFALELAVTDAEVRVLLAELFGELRDMVAGIVAGAAAAGGAELDSVAVADQFLAVVEGAIVLAKSYGDPAVPGRAVKMFADQLAPLLD